jgi:endonuclease/exonuclease/phosphatase family metal-dependent hydrolase
MTPRRLFSLFLALFFLMSLAPGRAAPEIPPTIRVLTYNIHHGVGLDEQLDLARIAALIKEQQADIVALQEVDRGVERTAKRDLAAELAALTGMNVFFGPNIRHQGGDYGNAVLTKFPIKLKRNSPLTMVGQGEQRGVIQLMLDVHGRDVLFMNTHLDSRKDEAERNVSADELAQLATVAGKTPVILCGDFNTAPATKAYAKIKTVLADAWELAGKGFGFTIPVEAPRRRIDYIWISAATIEPVQMKVLRSTASDHLPLFGEFRFR